MGYNYAHLIPLIKKTGSALSPKDFQEAVNVIFHDVEANHYDKLHHGMWNSLQHQVNLLIDDLLLLRQFTNVPLRILDIGCGTGLSTQLLINSKIGKFIDHITLLDTSPNMLHQAGIRATKWNRDVQLINGNITDLKGTYDIVLVCSVLHHIPDLEQFLKEVNLSQKSDAIFIHLNDPNGDYLKDLQYTKRLAEYGTRNQISILKRMLTGWMPAGVKNFIHTKLRKEPYINVVNEKLIKKSVIKKSMSPAEIWSVTDIHVEGLPYSTQTGISFKFLKENLSNYQLVSKRSYGFYGLLKAELTPVFQLLEATHIDNRELNGRLISGIWIKK